MRWQLRCNVRLSGKVIGGDVSRESFVGKRLRGTFTDSMPGDGGGQWMGSRPEWGRAPWPIRKAVARARGP
jgi:hypothetical protein